jgi:hypothetical protein
MMRIARLTTFLALLATVASLAGASSAALNAPTGLRGFMLRAADSPTAVFHRTPSFAWNPMAGAVRYQLQLSTSQTFQDNGMIFDSRAYLTPVAAPSLTLPWITGNPHSLYARVRAIFAGGGTSPWSAQYGFDLVPPDPPASKASFDGLLRWSQVDGATGYEVWVRDTHNGVTADKFENLNTNVMDEREFYAFHNDPTWIGDIHWRVRATRWNVLGRINGIPVATHGAWSGWYDSANAAPVNAPLQLVGTISDTFSNGTAASSAHTLMPGFVWTGNEALDGTPAPFFRVEIFTDSGCINRVFTGATVASPAYAPRLFGTLPMPTDPGGVTNASKQLLPDGSELNDFTADWEPLTPNDQLQAATPTTSVPGSKDKISVLHPDTVGAPVDLWDTAWPSSGYYWTAMPVQMVTGVDGQKYYQDMELAQDVCAAGLVQRFGISSAPALTGKNNLPYASGLSATGRLVSAASRAPMFYGEPLVAWTAVAAGVPYELQWSKKAYPFRPAGTRLTLATSAVLPLHPGTWYYRVRSFDYNLPTGAQEMSWSAPIRIVVAAPQLRITG